MRKLIYKSIFSMVLVLFTFVSVFKFPLTKATAEINKTSEIPVNLFEGIYYIYDRALYVWVVKNEIPENARFGVTYLDQNGEFHETDSFYFEDMVYATGDIQQLNPSSSFFSQLWNGVEHINRLVDAGYSFYNIRFGISKPFVDILYKVEYYGTNIIIPINPKNRIDDIFNYIDYLGEITEEDLLIEYNKGYNDGKEDGYADGYDDGYNKAYEEIDTNEEYMLGYRDGFKDGEKSKIAQNNEAFYKSIEKWLVPAIITVIIVGGIVSIIAIKRREQ